MFSRGYGCFGNGSGSSSVSGNGISNGIMFGGFNLILWIAIISVIVLAIISKK